jgi:hypothetical protein
MSASHLARSLRPFVLRLSGGGAGRGARRAGPFQNIRRLTLDKLAARDLVAGLRAEDGDSSSTESRGIE